MPKTNGATQESDLDLTLTVAAVAKRLGVAPDTLRTWDRRYGIGPSSHGPGQNRVYSLRDVARLDFMRNLVTQGVTPGKAAKIAKEQDLAPAKLNPPAGHSSDKPVQLPGNVVPIDSPKNLVRGLLRAANMLDSTTCGRIVGQLLESRGVLWTWDNVLVPTLKVIGEKWEETGLGIEVEHLIVDSIDTQLRLLFNEDFEPINARPVLLSCTAHELHTLPMLTIAAALAEQKISSRILGARLPADSLVKACKKIGPSAVLVWSQTQGTAEPEIWEAMSHQRPAPVLIAAGPGWSHLQMTNVVIPKSLGETIATLAVAVGRL